MDSDTFIKVFNVANKQVAIIDRGESDAKGCWDYEIVTKIDDITVAMTFPIPIDTSEEFFENYNQATANEFFSVAKQTLEGSS